MVWGFAFGSLFCWWGLLARFSHPPFGHLFPEKTTASPFISPPRRAGFLIGITNATATKTRKLPPRIRRGFSLKRPFRIVENSMACTGLPVYVAPLQSVVS